MAEIFADFSEPVLGKDGTAYLGRVAGVMTPKARWEGWIEFIPVAGGPPIRTPRETTQPTRGDIAYWATGLTRVYLEGAVERALSSTNVRHPTGRSAPQSDEPAPSTVRDAEAPVRDAVLDPFEVYAHGEEALRRKLTAFEAVHLVNIIVAYRLSAEPATALETLSRPALIELIVEAVRHPGRPK
jgi:hypothetical protein